MHYYAFDSAKGRRSIVQVADFCPSYSGNFIASLRALAELSKHQGFRTVWVFPEEARSRAWFRELSDQPDTAAYILPRRKSGYLKYAFEIARVAQREEAVILHSHFSRFDISIWLAKILCMVALRRVELIWHVHSAFPAESDRARRTRDLFKLGILGRFCHLITVSEELERSVLERGCPKQRVQVVRNGIDVAHATRRARSAAQVRQDLSVPDGSIMLLGFGWLPVLKGVDTMIEALEAVLHSGRKAVLVLVGVNNDLQRFVDARAPAQLRQSLRVIPPVEIVGDLFGAADVFISASRIEGFSYSVAEAMLNGVPVASTDIPALSWAADAPGVWFFRPGMGRALAELIGRLAEVPPEKRQATGRQSAAFIAHHLSVERWSRSIMHLYMQFLTSGRNEKAVDD